MKNPTSHHFWIKHCCFCFCFFLIKQINVSQQIQRPKWPQCQDLSMPILVWPFVIEKSIQIEGLGTNRGSIMHPYFWLCILPTLALIPVEQSGGAAGSTGGGARRLAQYFCVLRSLQEAKALDITFCHTAVKSSLDIYIRFSVCVGRLEKTFIDISFIGCRAWVHTWVTKKKKGEAHWFIIVHRLLQVKTKNWETQRNRDLIGKYTSKVDSLPKPWNDLVHFKYFCLMGIIWNHN